MVYRIVSAWPADLVTLAHQGSKACGESFELVHRREAEGPNAIWQADTLLSIFCWFGHRSTATTEIYAKVDVVTLRQIAQPWPEVKSC